jgi:hypothetical protein
MGRVSSLVPPHTAGVADCDRAAVAGRTFAGSLGAMFSLALLLAITLICLLILPAFLGAMAGKATGALVRVARHSRTRR